MEARRYAEACPRFAESQRLDPGGGTQMNLALCHEKEGKTATAWAEFNTALSQAIKDGRKDRLTLARERIAALEAILPRLTVTVAPGEEVAGLDVKLDGVSVGKLVLGSPAAVDPGTHRVDASAPGRQAWSVLVPITAGETKQIQVPQLSVESLVAVPPLPPPTYVSSPAPLAPQIVASSPPPPSPVAWQSATKPNPVFYTVLITGAVVLAASAITGGLALMEHNTSLEVCQPARQYCSDPNGITAAGNAHDLAVASTVTLGIGVLAGTLLLFIPTRSPIPISGPEKTASARGAALFAW